MAEAVLTSKGQVTIPKEIRQILKLKPKDKLVFLPDGDKAIMIPATRGTILDLYGSVKHEGEPINFKKLRKEFEKDMAQMVVESMK